MGWVRIDDSFYDHSKFHRVGALGLAAWIAGLAYCNRNLTDGFIPSKTARVIIDTDGLGYYVSNMAGRDAEAMDGVGELVAAGLWDEVDGGYRIHDYLDYQPSAEDVKAERDRNAARKAAWRASRNGSPDVSPNGTDSVSPNGSPNGSLNGSHAESPEPVTDPPNPNPNPEELTAPASDDAKPSRRKPHTKAPDLFPITDDMREWAATKARGCNVDAQTERFLSWHRSHDTRHADWRHAWRTWMLKAKPEPAGRKAGIGNGVYDDDEEVWMR